jgi:hypothetical protein
MKITSVKEYGSGIMAYWLISLLFIVIYMLAELS